MQAAGANRKRHQHALVSLFEIASIVRSCDHVWHHDFGLFLAAAILLNLTPGRTRSTFLGRTIAQVARPELHRRSNFSWQYFHTCARHLDSRRFWRHLPWRLADQIAGWQHILSSLESKMILDRRKQLSLPSSFSPAHNECGISSGYLGPIFSTQRWRSSSWRFFRSSSTLDPERRIAEPRETRTHRSSV